MKRFLLICLMLLLPATALAQTYVSMPSPVMQFLDENGDPYAGGKLYTYTTGTTNDLATYSDTVGTENANPVILDSAGRAVVYLSAATYKFRLDTSADVTVWTQDVVASPNLFTSAVAHTTITVSGTGAASINTAGGIQVDSEQVIGADGMLTVEGTGGSGTAGPHNIGGSASARTQLSLGGTFAPTVGDDGVVLELGSTVTCQASLDCYGIQIQPTLNNASSGTHARMASLAIEVPDFGSQDGLITEAAAIWIGGPPTKGDNNYAILIDNGNFFIGGTGTIEIQGPDPGAGRAGEGTLTLSSANVAVTATDRIGRIDFQTPLESDGTDSILVGASIWAEAEDTFAVDNNETAIVFGTGESETATEKMRLAATGYLGIGTSFSPTVTPQSLLDVRGPTGSGTATAGLVTLSTAETTVVAADELGRIDFVAPVEASGTDAVLVGGLYLGGGRGRVQYHCERDLAGLFHRGIRNSNAEDDRAVLGRCRHGNDISRRPSGGGGEPERPDHHSH